MKVVMVRVGVMMMVSEARMGVGLIARYGDGEC